MALFVTIVLDGVGVGWQPDAHMYGDEGANTLQHVCDTASPKLPELAALGLGCILPLDGVPPAATPLASFGRMTEVSAGKDSTTGHWELAGLRLDAPFPTYPDGFPDELISRFVNRTGVPAVLGGHPVSGTAVIEQFGEEHIATGKPIVYTSADSVLQVATHADVCSLAELYRICEVARSQVCTGQHAVGRVIARPFAGEPGGFVRLSDKRRDFALQPPAPVLQQRLQSAGVHTISIGKIADLFAGAGFDATIKTSGNSEGVIAIVDAIREYKTRDPKRDTFVWVNLVDFDQDYGHRNDPDGFARALEQFDAALPSIRAELPSDSALVITADHGNDPTFPGTDHTREYVPLLVYGVGACRDVGTRHSFADHARSVLAYFNVDSAEIDGTSSFL